MPCIKPNAIAIGNRCGDNRKSATIPTSEPKKNPQATHCQSLPYNCGDFSSKAFKVISALSKSAIIFWTSLPVSRSNREMASLSAFIGDTDSLRMASLSVIVGREGGVKLLFMVVS